jgi:anti-sigma factor RsiW
MMSHEQASELLGAYALDAVDGEELTELEHHLDECPRCRAELDSLREVAGALGTGVETVPEGLWSSIASRLPERPHEETPPPMPRLVRSGRSPAEGASRRRRGRVAVATLAAVAVALVAVAAVLGVGLINANDRADNLQQTATGRSSTVTAALQTPGHRVVSLRDGKHMLAVQFVVVPDGRGYLLASHLPALASGKTYQLWGIVGSQAISLGLLGPHPGEATFTMAGARRPSSLALTAEPAGGTAGPTGPILAMGAV